MYPILAMLPKNLISRIAGIIMRIYIPKFLRNFIIGGFARKYRIRLSDAQKPVSEYPNLDAFFTRKLKPGLRPLPEKNIIAISPVDGMLSSFGSIDSNQSLIQAKGFTYTLADFLQNSTLADQFSNGFFLTFYLSPQDYHRIHSPICGAIAGSAYIPGKLWPVNEWAVNHVQRLFAVNERMITYQQSGSLDENTEALSDETIIAQIDTATIMVGALNVGKMSLAYTDIQSNTWWRSGFHWQRQKNSYLKTGDEMGTFHLGSTVIVLFKSGIFIPKSGLKPGKILMGTEIGHLNIHH